MFGTDNSVSAGVIDPQTTVTLTPPQTFFFGTEAPSAPSVTDASGVVTLAAASAEPGTVDLNAAITFNAAQAFTGTYSSFDANGRTTIAGNGGSILYLISPTKAVLIGTTSTGPAIQVVEQSSDRRIPDPTRECGRRVGAIGPAFFFAGLRIENKYWVGKTNDGDGLCASRGGRGHEGFGKLQYLGIHANFVVGA